MRVPALLLLLATPAFAETIEVQAPVTEVTLYPGVASVSRTVSFTAPAGTHDIVIPGLPPTEPQYLRVTAPDGVSVGAISLAEARIPATGDQTPPEVRAAQGEVERLEATLRDRRSAIAAIRAKGEAAGARAAFLQSLATTKGEDSLTATGIEDLRALTALVGEEVLSARQTALAAETEAAAAETALRPDIEALDRARAALAALTLEGEDPQVLTLTTQVAAAGPVTLTVTTLSVGGWYPVYDLYLTRTPAALRIARGVLVLQESGEDWRDVTLTLSTATPGDQTAPSPVWTDLRRIEPEVTPEDLARKAAAESLVLGGLAEPAMDPAPVVELAASGYSFDPGLQGLTFTYRFSAPVTIRSGADALRLVLDEVTPDVTLRAEAAPLTDTTAYLVAEVTNTTGQPLLPGTALHYADGAFAGESELPLIPAGAKEPIGFGSIDGLRLTRTVPSRSEGEEGILTSSNRREETAIISVENLTDETWPVHLTDRVPYSEQDDLTITWTADPAPSETDPEGQRGLLVWTFDMAPKETRTITLDSRIAWPNGMELQ